MLSCSIRFSAPSFWKGGGLESRCVGRVYSADGAVVQSTCQCKAFFIWFPFQYVFCSSGQKHMASINNFLVATIFSLLGIVM